MKLKKITLVFVILDIIIIMILGLMLGPLKSKIINNNLNKHVLVNTLYKENDVLKGLAKKTSIKIKNKIDYEPKLVEINSSKFNDYETQVLTPDEGNDEYKLINLKVGGYDSFLVVIYNPSKVHIVTKEVLGTEYGESLIKMCNRYNASVCINGGEFVDYGYGSGIPGGYVIEGGKIRWPQTPTDRRSNLIAITNDSKLKLLTNVTGEEAIEQGVMDALEFGPFLIVDGKVQDVGHYSVGGYLGAARVAIAQRRDGIMLFLVTNGVHGRGSTMAELIETLVNYGAYNAANLDGGASSSLVINGKLTNTPRNIYGEVVVGGRTVVDGFGLLR